MNAIKYLHNRFSFAIKNNGTIKVNQQDVESINILVESQKKENTDLEDSLLLFYLFWTYTIENENNKIKLREKPVEEIKFPLGISTPYLILEKLSKILDPKEFIIKKIADEIWVYQEYERLCKNQELRNEELREIQEGGGKFTEDENGIKSYYVTPQETIPIDKKTTYEEIKEIIENALKTAKQEFPMIKAIKSGLWKN